ncbi:MAG TPA: hypothetical protein VF041_00560, partial [Gemmatimonadaceae bacterium]
MSMVRKLGRWVLRLLLVLFAFIGLEYTTRGTPVSRVSQITGQGAPPAASDSLFERTMELFTGTTLEPGNHVEVLANGDETYPRLWSDLRSARQSITIQMYYCKPGRMADTLAAILSDRARAGVRVLFLHDAFGSQDLTEGYLDSLRA